MSCVLYSEADQIGQITINRPDALNALNTEVLNTLFDVLSMIDIDNIRALIITGAGARAFVAGADISEMSELDRNGAEAFSKFGNELFLKLERFALPTIAAVNGYALGGGCELALSCDMRVCSDNAVFGQPEVGLGIIPGFGGTQRLARIVGINKAKEMIYTAKNIKADEAYRIGLVNAVYSSDILIAEARKLAGIIAANAPKAVKHAKQAINDGFELTIDEGITIENVQFGRCFETEDRRVAMSAFLEKRKHEPFTNK